MVLCTKGLRKLVFAVSTILLLVVPARPLRADGGPGVQAGISVNPEQFYFAGQYEIGPVTDKIWFRPNLDVGFGNGATLVGVNVELVYYFKTNQLKDWKIYTGGGPALNYYRISNYGLGLNNNGFEPGLNLLGGLAHKKGLFVELKVGVLDSPDVRFGFGYIFHKK